MAMQWWHRLIWLSMQVNTAAHINTCKKSSLYNEYKSNYRHNAHTELYTSSIITVLLFFILYFLLVLHILIFDFHTEMHHNTCSSFIPLLLSWVYNVSTLSEGHLPNTHSSPNIHKIIFCKTFSKLQIAIPAPHPTSQQCQQTVFHKNVCRL